MTNLIENRKVYFNYEIMEKLSAGMELFGSEVKSLRNKQGSLEGSHVTIRGNEAFLIGADIPPYQPSNSAKEYDSRRNRRLLLTKKELTHLGKEEGKKGLTIVPISVYNSRNLIKLEIAIVRGKKKFDKRETIKKRETDREIRRLNTNRF